jgi:hypothetical protein
MKWVTRSHVHVDRIACPWLISKFIDADAQFVFVPWPGPLPPSDLGIPFDFPNTDFALGHHDGRCTFEAVIAKYKVTDPWVKAMATIVHAADVAADIDTAPEARGVEAVSAGSMYLVRDDYEALERGFALYDALYVYVQLAKIREQYKDALAKMDRRQHFDFMKAHVKAPPTARVRRPLP